MITPSCFGFGTARRTAEPAYGLARSYMYMYLRYTYTQAHDAHAPNKPPVRPSSQASSHVDSARRAASQTDRGTAALACRRPSHSYSYLLTRRHRRRSLVDSSLHLETRCSMDTRGGTPRASRVSNNHCALPGSYPSPCRAVPRPTAPSPARPGRVLACTRGTRPLQVSSSLSQLIS